MHDSSLPTLEDVVSHYANVNVLVPNLDSRVLLNSFLFSDEGIQTNPFLGQGKADLVSFLMTLTGSSVYTDPKWADPFSPDGQLDLRLMSDDSLDFQIIRSTSSLFLDLRLRVAPHQIYRLEKSTDLKNWTPLEFILGEVGKVHFLFPISKGEEKVFHRLVFRKEDQPLASFP